MEVLPKTQHALVVRTAFDNEEAWRAVCEMIRRPVSDGFGGEFLAYVEFVDNPSFRDLTAQELMGRVPVDFENGFLMVVDADTLRSPDRPILVIELRRERGRSFRAIPIEIQGIENISPLRIWTSPISRTV